jgi:hypothetical protein
LALVLDYQLLFSDPLQPFLDPVVLSHVFSMLPVAVRSIVNLSAVFAATATIL